MEMLLFYGLAVVVGAAHTFEPDHLAAVGAFVVRKPHPRTAVAYGLQWAAGHGGVILLAGTLLVALRVHLPAGTGAILERLVGATLVVLGAWVFIDARRLHAHGHVHADGTVHSHLHAHAEHAHREEAHSTEDRGHGEEEAHEHGAAATAMGAVHGLAGTAPAVALLPLATFESVLPAVAYLVAFGVGTAISMALYALFAGTLAAGAGRRSTALGRGLARVAGVGTVVVGLVWMLGG